VYLELTLSPGAYVYTSSVPEPGAFTLVSAAIGIHGPIVPSGADAARLSDRELFHWRVEGLTPGLSCFLLRRNRNTGDLSDQIAPGQEDRGRSVPE